MSLNQPAADGRLFRPILNSLRGHPGVLTGNDKLLAEGKADQAVGEDKQVADKAVDKVKQAVKKLRD